MSSLWKLATLAGFFICLSEVSPARPRIAIKPKYAHINSNETLILSCNAQQPLIGCQFNVGKNIIDLHTDAKSRLPQGYKYHGAGMNRGFCGMKISSLTLDTGHGYAVECRGRSQEGSWVYDTATVYVSDDGALPHFTSEPDGDLVALPGQSISLLHRASQNNLALTACSIKLLIGSEYKWLNFSEGRNSDLQNGVAYFGAGLEHGQCGFKILSVSERNNGRLWSQFNSALSSGRAVELTYTSLIVAKPPESTSFNVFKNGDTLTATCSASNSRPVANITWFLDNDVIRSDEDDDAPVDEINWVLRHDLQSISQTISLSLRAEVYGKTLTCRIQHLAMKGSGFIDLTRTISEQNSSDQGSFSFVVGLTILNSVLIVVLFLFILFLFMRRTAPKTEAIEMAPNADQQEKDVCKKPVAKKSKGEVTAEKGRLKEQ